MEIVDQVYKSGLCHGCGICSTACPHNAISIVLDRTGRYHPLLETGKCTRCGQCIKVCSGWECDYKKITQSISGRESGFDNGIGNYILPRVGYATDPAVRKNSSSGGIITQLLITALEEKWIDAAITTGPDQTNFPHSKAVVADSKEVLLYTAKSIYSMTTIGDALKAAMTDKERIAVVGLPCQLASIRKAQQVLPVFKKKVKLLLGLMDGHNVVYHLTDYFLNKQKLNKRQWLECRYRGEKWWTFNINLLDENKEKTSIDWKSSVYNTGWEAKLFTPERCMRCRDFAAELADISFADAWLEEYKNNQEGYSIILTRTNVGEKMISDLKELGLIKVSNEDINKLHQSSKYQIDFKKRTGQIREKLLGSKKKQYIYIPVRKEEYEIRIVDWLINIELVIVNKWSLWLAGHGLAKWLPLILLEFYSKYSFVKLAFRIINLIVVRINRLFKSTALKKLAEKTDIYYTYEKGRQE